MKHDVQARVEWLLAVFGAMAAWGFLIGLVIRTLTGTTVLEWIALILAILLVLPGGWVFTCAVVNRAYAWSTIEIQGTTLSQRMFGGAPGGGEICLDRPFSTSYVYVFGRVAVLPHPEWAVEFRQGEAAIRLNPRRLTPKVRIEDLPMPLQIVWRQYRPNRASDQTDTM